MNTNESRPQQRGACLPSAPRIAIIGCFGFNFNKRVRPELINLNPDGIVGYDLIGQKKKELPFRSFLVRDDDELAERLGQQRPDIVLIETPDACHDAHIRIALRSGARLIVCEKPLAVSIAEADELVGLCRQSEPDQRVFIIDHYVNIELVKALVTWGQAFVGQIDAVEAVLFETQGIPEHQIRSHQNGMANFIHHCFAIAGKLHDLKEVVAVEGARANHDDSPVPDSYRRATLRSRQQPQLTIRAAVGKYIKSPSKHISLKGRRGTAMLDRDHHRLRLSAIDSWGMTVLSDHDAGYRGLAQCLATGQPLPSFLSVHEAREVVRLVDDVHKSAVKLDEYPDGTAAVFGARPRGAKRAG